MKAKIDAQPQEQEKTGVDEQKFNDVNAAKIRFEERANLLQKELDDSLYRQLVDYLWSGPAYCRPAGEIRHVRLDRKFARRLSHQARRVSFLFSFCVDDSDLRCAHFDRCARQEILLSMSARHSNDALAGSGSRIKPPSTNDSFSA